MVVGVVAFYTVFHYKVLFKNTKIIADEDVDLEDGTFLSKVIKFTNLDIECLKRSKGVDKKASLIVDTEESDCVAIDDLEAAVATEADDELSDDDESDDELESLDKLRLRGPMRSKSADSEETRLMANIHMVEAKVETTSSDEEQMIFGETEVLIPASSEKIPAIKQGRSESNVSEISTAAPSSPRGTRFTGASRLLDNMRTNYSSDSSFSTLSTLGSRTLSNTSFTNTSLPHFPQSKTVTRSLSDIFETDSNANSQLQSVNGGSANTIMQKIVTMGSYGTLSNSDAEPEPEVSCSSAEEADAFNYKTSQVITSIEV